MKKIVARYIYFFIGSLNGLFIGIVPYEGRPLLFVLMIFLTIIVGLMLDRE